MQSDIRGDRVGCMSQMIHVLCRDVLRELMDAGVYIEVTYM